MKVLVSEDHGYREWLLMVKGCGLKELQRYVKSLFEWHGDFMSPSALFKALPYMNGVEYVALPIASTDKGWFVLKEEHAHLGEDVKWDENPEMFRPMDIRSEGIRTMMGF
jgi:hypothetical protein